MRELRYLLIPALLLAITAVYGQEQNDFKVKIFKNLRSDVGLSYNFFTGPDSKDFSTTIDGFGSGFLFDFSGRYSREMILIGTDNVNFTLGGGIALNKYRFSENLLLSLENGQMSYSIDDDPARDYGEGFFSYGKSKLVTTNFFIPASINFHVGEFLLSATGNVDFYIWGKHKRKFKVDGDKTKTVIRNDDFNDFPINKVKAGVGALIMHKPTGLNVGFTYMMTPFFDVNEGPEINEMRVSVSYDIKLKKI